MFDESDYQEDWGGGLRVNISAIGHDNKADNITSELADIQSRTEIIGQSRRIILDEEDL